MDKIAIENEIHLMQSFKGVPGIVQLEGIIMDTPAGYIPNKLHPGESHPILVMELLEGGDLYSKIAKRRTISEQDLVRLFRNIIKSVQNIHQQGYIHRYVTGYENYFHLFSC